MKNKASAKETKKAKITTAKPKQKIATLKKEKVVKPKIKAVKAKTVKVAKPKPKVVKPKKEKVVKPKVKVAKVKKVKAPKPKKIKVAKVKKVKAPKVKKVKVAKVKKVKAPKVKKVKVAKSKPIKVQAKKEKIVRRNNPFLVTACVFMGIILLGVGAWLILDKPGYIAKVVNERYVVIPYGSETTPAGNALEDDINTVGIPESESYAEAVSEPRQLKQWSDTNYTYTTFYLGYIKNVPIDHQTSAYFDGKNEVQITYEKSICTQSSVETSLSKCEEITKSESHTASASATVTASGGCNFFVVGGDLSVSATAGWEGTWADSKTVSTTDTYTSAKSFSEQSSFSIAYTISSGTPGHYRYTLFATTDVFCVARTDGSKVGGKTVYDLDYGFFAKPETYFYSLDYSADNIFDSSATAETKLELKAEEVEDLKVLPKQEPTPEPPEIIITTVTYDSSTDKDMKDRERYGDDDQYYGMNTAYADCDKLDMTAFKSYFFTNKYTFEFNFALSMNITNGGSQEFYLYNKCQSGMNTKAKYYRSQAYAEGLLFEKLFNLSNGVYTQYITARIPGDIVKSTMFTKFGADGSGEDKWRIVKLTCTTKVFASEKVEVYNGSKDNIPNASGKVIKGDGEWGIKATDQADKISLAKYADKLTNSYNIVLTFAILMHEDDDGTQEIYLYNNKTKNSGSSKDDAYKCGMVKYVGTSNASNSDFDFNRTTGTDVNDAWLYFTVKLKGGLLSSDMYLRYDSHGSGGNSYYLKQVYCYIAVQ